MAIDTQCEIVSVEDAARITDNGVAFAASTYGS
jgi:hypothetical protein